MNHPRTSTTTRTPTPARTRGSSKATRPKKVNKASKASKASKAKRIKPRISHKRVRSFVNELFGPTEHAQRVQSLANAVVGITQVAVLAIHAIGQAYAQVAGITAKSGVKQIDRLLSNDNFQLERVLQTWVSFVVGARKQVVIALDWTEFDDDKHSTLAAYLVTNHGRATPLAWQTHAKATLKGNQKRYEYELIEQVHRWIDPNVEVILLADRGFGDQKLYDYLIMLGWDFTIRFRGGITVTAANGETKTAQQWVSASGRAKMLRKAKVTDDAFEVPAVVVAWDRKMKEPWCLATTLAQRSASEVVKVYGKRFSIEETFRDQKDLHFGMGLKATHIGKAARRDRLLLLAAVAQALLTLLGAAAEAAGLDRYLKVNTVKRRTHSLFRQGLYWYHALPNTRREWLVPLMREFDRLLREHAVFNEIFGAI
jgi:hypothetical protein